MLKLLDEIFNRSQQECESLPKANVRLDAGFITAYEKYIEDNAPAVGGFTKVAFDDNGARFEGRSETVVANDGFLRANTLIELYGALREYQTEFKTLYSDLSKRQLLAVAQSLKEAESAAISDLDERLLHSSLSSEDRKLLKKFLTQYDWWHGKKSVDREDFINSPLLNCANLVAASNGAIPSIVQHLHESSDARVAFKYSINSLRLTIKRNNFQDNLSIDQLVEELKNMVVDDQTKSSAYRILGLKYPKSLANVKREDLLRKAGLGESYEVEIHKGIKLHELIAAKKWGLSFGDDKLQPPEPPQKVDKLTIALKLFKEQREAHLEYDDYARQARAMFKDVDGAKLIAIDWNEFCSKHFSGSQSSAHFRGYDNAAKTALGDWLKSVREDAQDIAHELDRVPKFDGLKSFGTTICMFLMKANPKSFCSFAEQGFNSLVFLGLESKKRFPEVSVESYYHNKELQTQVLAAMEKLGIKNEDDGAADYLTVNEFLWFVHDNEDLIKEKVMSKQMKNEAPTKRQDKGKKLKFNNDNKDDELLLRLLSALHAKPFAILAGHSGTGKSRYVKKLAYMTCNCEELKDENKLPGNYLLLQVKPNWHDSTDLLGFRNAMDDGKYQKTALIEFLFRAYHFKATPFFLCLDEMNLAPVEQYFAEFLSAMESREPVPLNDITEREENLFDLGCEWTDSMEYVKEHGFSIPPNLFIVGTVNMDETTCQFSRKVLDRAFTIEMTNVDFTKFGKVKEPSYADMIDDTTIGGFLKRHERITNLDDEDIGSNSSLIKVQKALEPTAFAIAYRFASEYTLLKRAIERFGSESEMRLDALDQAVLMKVLPRIAGEEKYIRSIYGDTDNEGLRKALEGKTASLNKIKEILDRAKNTGAQYITFWP